MQLTYIIQKRIFKLLYFKNLYFRNLYHFIVLGSFPCGLGMRLGIKIQDTCVLYRLVLNGMNSSLSS